MTDEARATNVIEALSRVIRDMPGIGKDGRADPKQGGYAYRGIEQITRAAQPLLALHGVVFTTRGIRDVETIDITVNGKPWTDTRLIVEWRIYGPGGVDDFIDVEVAAIGRDNSDKGANKCMTQAFKYALLPTLCIADTKDDADGQTLERDYVPSPTAVLDASDIENAKPRELAAALAAADLPQGGTPDEMRARLREALAAEAADEFVGAGETSATPEDETVVPDSPVDSPVPSDLLEFSDEPFEVKA